MVPFILFLESEPVLSVSVWATLLPLSSNILSCTSGSDYVSSTSYYQIRSVVQFFNEYVFPVLVCIDSNLSLGRLLPMCKHLYMAYAFSVHRSQVEALYKSTTPYAANQNTTTPSEVTEVPAYEYEYEAIDGSSYLNRIYNWSKWTVLPSYDPKAQWFTYRPDTVTQVPTPMPTSPLLVSTPSPLVNSSSSGIIPANFSNSFVSNINNSSSSGLFVPFAPNSTNKSHIFRAISQHLPDDDF